MRRGYNWTEIVWKWLFALQEGYRACFLLPLDTCLLLLKADYDLFLLDLNNNPGYFPVLGQETDVTLR